MPSVITDGADGLLWVTLQDKAQLATVSTTGAVALRPVADLAADAMPTGIALGPDGRLWFAEFAGNAISTVNLEGADRKRYALPHAASGPLMITNGPDGNLWFTQSRGDRIGKIAPNGAITEFPLPTGSQPTWITTGPDKNLWFTVPGVNAIARITPAGAVTTFALPITDSKPYAIVPGADGNLWFTETGSNRIGRITPAGVLAEFDVPTASSGPLGIAAGPDGAVWFTQSLTGKVARITRAGVVTEFALPAGQTKPVGLSAGADGNMWVIEQVANRVSRVLTGVTPQAKTAPTITGTSTAIGATLTASYGEWAYQPSTFVYQWQRCVTEAASSCVDIGGATAATRTVTADDAGGWVRVLVKATNSNGTSSEASASALTKIGPKPVPPAVNGDVRAVIAPGVTATLKAVNKTKRKVLRNFRVNFTSAKVRGKVRMTLVNAAGVEVLVIAPGRWAVRTGPNAAQSARWKRIPKRIWPGNYTLRAVFTPHPDEAANFAVATLVRPITIK